PSRCPRFPQLSGRSCLPTFRRILQSCSQVVLFWLEAPLPMNSAVRTRGLAYGTIASRRAEAIAVHDGTLATAVGQVLSKSRAFAVSSRAANCSVRFATSRWQDHRHSPHRFFKTDFNCVIRSE